MYKEDIWSQYKDVDIVNKYINYAPLEAEIFELIYISRSYSSTKKAQTTEYWYIQILLVQFLS